MHLLAETLPPLVTQQGGATAFGIWVLMAITFCALVLWIYNQARQAQVNTKILNAPAVTPQEMAQPFVIELKKQFATTEDFSNHKREQADALAEHKRDTASQLKEMRSYMHEMVHAIREDIQAVSVAGVNGREGIHDRINTLVEVTFEMRGPHSRRGRSRTRKATQLHDQQCQARAAQSAR